MQSFLTSVPVAVEFLLRREGRTEDADSLKASRRKWQQQNDEGQASNKKRGNVGEDEQPKEKKQRPEAEPEAETGAQPQVELQHEPELNAQPEPQPDQPAMNNNPPLQDDTKEAGKPAAGSASTPSPFQATVQCLSCLCKHSK